MSKAFDTALIKILSSQLPCEVGIIIHTFLDEEKDIQRIQKNSHM